jgi:hypothetical protein
MLNDPLIGLNDGFDEQQKVILVNASAVFAILFADE